MTVPQGRQRPATSRQRHRENRQRIVLEAAERLISRDGLAQFSMRLLARECGIPAPTLYGYFDSKESVLAALADERIALLREYVLCEAQHAKPGTERLLAFARGYRRFATEGMDYYSMFLSRSSILSSGDVRKTASMTGLDLIRTLAVDVQIAVEQGEMAPVDPEETIIALWSIAHGYLSLELQSILPEWEVPLERREETYLRYFEAMLRGIQAVEPLPEPASEAE